MNPAGVPAFYGAFASEVAVAEVRPAVGSIVIVARFFPTRDLRVLDLTKLARLYAQDSRFSESYATTLSRLKFLRSFESRISRVVLPSDELIDYLPTQAVAAYVTNVLGLDGIIYRSRQVIPDGYEMSGAESLNIALFGSAANVQDTDTWEPAPRPEYFHVLVAPFITPLIEAYERERFRRGLRKGGGLRIELTPPPAALLTTRVTVGSKPLDVHSLDDNRFTIVDVDDLYERDDDDD